MLYYKHTIVLNSGMLRVNAFSGMDYFPLAGRACVCNNKNNPGRRPPGWEISSSNEA